MQIGAHRVIQPGMTRDQADKGTPSQLRRCSAASWGMPRALTSPFGLGQLWTVERGNFRPSRFSSSSETSAKVRPFFSMATTRRCFFTSSAMRAWERRAFDEIAGFTSGIVLCLCSGVKARVFSSSSSLASSCSWARYLAMIGSSSSASCRSFRCMSSSHSLRFLASSMAGAYERGRMERANVA